MRLNLDQVQCILNAKIIGAEDAKHTEIKAVCRDTNDVTAQSLFVCIIGQRVDGHDFAQKAVQLGASALLVSRRLEDICVPQIIVTDTVKALGLLANAWRKMFKGLVIGITGSAGKTTLKESLAQVLDSAGKQVAKNKLNYNNQIGLPLSILGTNLQEDYWVMEAGISQSHDMDELGEILEPDMAIILNVGAAHTEGLGDKGVAWHKAQLLKYLQKSSIGAFVCADYAELVEESNKLCENISFFSAQGSGIAKYNASYLELVAEQGKYELSIHGEKIEVLAPFYGAYGAENIAAIAAISHSIGINNENIIKGIAEITLPKQRFNTHTHGDWTVIDDSYNANALSMQRMLEAVSSTSRTCYAVLGSMGELGELASIEHEKLGKIVAKLNISVLFWKGNFAKEVQIGLASEHYKGQFIIADDCAEFSKQWSIAKLAPATVLCKGSRSNVLEEYVQIILEQIKKII